MARRRYRLLTLCAVVILFLLYRVAQNAGNEPALYYEAARAPAEPQVQDQPDASAASFDASRHQAVRPQPLPDGEHPPELAVEGFPKVTIPDQADSQDATSEDGTKHETTEGKTPGKQEELLLKDKVPPKNDLNDDPRKDANEEEHWKKQAEHFAVPPDKLAQLPSGTPKKLPKIQFDFAPESPGAKAMRQGRLQKVRDAISRTWDGYRKHAWMHDELSPVSAKFRDPFCGWAATLVDSLDTLWISGMTREFDEAAKAVENIDFTYSDRSKIPVFETVIRYLGGLLAAYDVSGGEKGGYKMLLDKAVELAEILMGAFDTPNRMPVLHYSWSPMIASQPHRARSGNVAELATLSMEFTRLAQLTGSAKYYDAINRITDALVDMQERNDTAIPGLFPEQINLSGCNKIPETDPDTLSKAAQQQFGAEDALGEPSGYPADGDVITPAGHAALDEMPAVPEDSRWADREGMDKRSPVLHKRAPTPPLAANGESIDWDCKSQALAAAGSQSFSMGGCQDSAYEYFPKEYMLLGGLEDKYRKLHEDTIAAIDEWLLFRPMIKDDDKWDILFASKVDTESVSDAAKYHYWELTHLSCFLGGMYGLGAKIFEREQDLETAKRLTDGCVWAYQATPSGLMPESARVLPCPGLDKCEFNQTLWYEKLDPSATWRDEEAARWDAEQAERNAAEQLATEAQKEGETVQPQGSAEDAALAESLKQKASEAEDGHVPAKRDMPKGVPQLAVPRKAGKGPDDSEEVSSSASVSERPKTHHEYVTEMIEEQGYAPGIVDVHASSYILRPEAIESVWYMYRITGDPGWQEKGWAMFEATIRATRTDFAFSAISDVMSGTPHLTDEMESFWLAETLKYYYLLFSEPDVISLDEYVLNTEAHPFKRPA